ncbi:HNH endonuclease [Naumannella sp. ID2617S]|nr:HNH endonuclease [Naumannella sp. ID2617S]
MLLMAWVPVIVRKELKRKYFSSDDSSARKNAINELVNDHNELAHYIGEIRRRGSFNVGRSDKGQHAPLAHRENVRRHPYKHDRYMTEYAPNVQNCSLQIVHNASLEPIKYVMKYFGIAADEATLTRVESMGPSIAQLEAAIASLREREESIAQEMDPPRFIKKYFMNEFVAQVGVELNPITVPYPTYIFVYTSAGGNSTGQTSLTLNTKTVDALVETMSDRIRIRKSVAGQRALMTTRLRKFIKERDDYTCKRCGVSVHTEPHLLLEIDHVIPVSRGGLTEEANLQTLCWKCNRAKSNRMG